MHAYSGVVLRDKEFCSILKSMKVFVFRWLTSSGLAFQVFRTSLQNLCYYGCYWLRTKVLHK